MPKTIKKSVFPVAGLGTRFLPATKASPKEMLPVVDQPLIAYAVKEAMAAGIEQIIFVTAMEKRAIENYFDRHLSLEQHLQTTGKLKLLESVQSITPPDISFVYVRQHQPLGLGHAVLCARDVIGDHAFAVILADDLIDENPVGTCLQEMITKHTQTGGHVMAHQAVPASQVDQYGMMDLEDDSASVSRIRDVIEKPAIGQAPSLRAVIGRYILAPSIFDALAGQAKGAGNEIQLTDAIRQTLSSTGGHGYQLKGQRFDCGSKLGYMQANVHFALRHPEIAEDFKASLNEMLSTSQHAQPI